jgi:hypothetical protein
MTVGVGRSYPAVRQEERCRGFRSGDLVLFARTKTGGYAADEASGAASRRRATEMRDDSRTLLGDSGLITGRARFS